MVMSHDDWSGRCGCLVIWFCYHLIAKPDNKTATLPDPIMTPLQLCHKESNGVSNHWRLHCLLNCWFRHRWKKPSKLYVTGLCVGNSPVTGEFPAQKASNAENVSIWWRDHATLLDSHMCHFCWRQSNTWWRAVLHHHITSATISHIIPNHQHAVESSPVLFFFYWRI